MSLKVQLQTTQNRETIKNILKEHHIETTESPNFPILKIHETSTQFELQEIDLCYWLKRAIKRLPAVKMVQFSTDKEKGDLIYPASFEGKCHDGYRDLGIELTSPEVTSKSEASTLPVTRKGTQKALLLDRDGIINRDDRYIFEYENVIWVDGIVDLIKYAKDSGLKVVVVTNQSGIGRGYYTADQMHSLHSQMNQQLTAWGCAIDSWYFCPFHTDGINEYKGYSLLRKPFPAMALQAQEEFSLDLENSIMIGDKKSDKLKDLDMTTFFLQGNYDLSEEENVFQTHFEIIDHLKKINWP